MGGYSVSNQLLSLVKENKVNEGVTIATTEFPINYCPQLKGTGMRDLPIKLQWRSFQLITVPN